MLDSQRWRELANLKDATVTNFADFRIEANDGQVLIWIETTEVLRLEKVGRAIAENNKKPEM